jgi:hypothetical protein
VPKSGVERVSGGAFGLGCIGNQSAKPERGHLAGAAIQRYSRVPEIRKFDHDDSSALSRIQDYRSGVQSSSWKARRSSFFQRYR